jgi:16S rRNA U1498 N3-methylase RsmE
MQLFIADYSIKGNGIIITDADILAQARKVLRLTAGDQFRIQDTKA